jgi:hypothetical protein
MNDPIALVERVCRQILEQLTHEQASASNGDAPAEELITAALATRLAEMIVGDGSVGEENIGAQTYLGEALFSHEEVVERVSELAAALGACECWGEYVDCPTCAGAGGPGWTYPDKRLFARYVHPAVSTLKGPGDLRHGPNHASRNDQARDEHPSHKRANSGTADLDTHTIHVPAMAANQEERVDE